MQVIACTVTYYRALVLRFVWKGYWQRSWRHKGMLGAFSLLNSAPFKLTMSWELST